MKIYTKTGDSGETSLYGCRVPKNHPVLDVIGALDELNAVLGVVLTQTKSSEVKEQLIEVQNNLFTLGSEFACPPGKAISGFEMLADGAVEKLEQMIDVYENSLMPLKNFILPGGTMSATLLQQARAMSRRAERAAVDLTSKQAVRPTVLKYLNRLSDYLFVLARFVNHQAGSSETIWQGASGK